MTEPGFKTCPHCRSLIEGESICPHCSKPIGSEPFGTDLPVQAKDEFWRALEERYPRRPVRAFFIWGTLSVIALFCAGGLSEYRYGDTTGPISVLLSIVAVPLLWIGWKTYRGKLIRKQQRRLTSYCARLRLGGQDEMARAIEKYAPLSQRSPEVVDDILAEFGAHDFK